MTTFYTSVQIDTEDIKGMSNIYVIMQQRKACFITVNMLLMKRGHFEGFQYKTCLFYCLLLSSMGIHSVHSIHVFRVKCVCVWGGHCPLISLLHGCDVVIRAVGSFSVGHISFSHVAQFPWS